MKEVNWFAAMGVGDGMGGKVGLERSRIGVESSTKKLEESHKHFPRQ